MIRRLPLADLKPLLGEISATLERCDSIAVLECEIYVGSGLVLLDLRYISVEDTAISATAISGKYIESVLRYYLNQGIRLMVAASGMFWIREPLRRKGSRECRHALSPGSC